MVAVEHIRGIHVAYMVPGTVFLRRLDRFFEQLPGGNRGKGAGKMELGSPVGIRAGALGDHQVVKMDMLLNGPGGSHPDDVLHTVAGEQLMGIDADGGHAHAGGHDGHPDALIKAGIALNAPDIIHKHRIFQEIFRDKFGTQGITGHQDGLSKVPRCRGDMGSRGNKHFLSSFIPLLSQA